MLSYLTVLKTRESKNKKIGLTEMSKIGIVALITISKRNLMECTLTIHPTSMMNGLKKIRGRENSTKKSGPSEQGMVKTQLEIVEME